jgi:hypothetical protein
MTTDLCVYVLMTRSCTGFTVLNPASAYDQNPDRRRGRAISSNARLHKTIKMESGLLYTQMFTCVSAP